MTFLTLTNDRTGLDGFPAGFTLSSDQPSDPFLMTGYDHKELELQHDADKAATLALEADLCGDGQWTVVQRFVVPPGDTVRHVYPRGWSAYWVRLRVDVACAATAQFTYR